MNQIGLIFECPKLNEKEDCPFKSIRKICDIRVRIYKWKSINSIQRDEMITSHLLCCNLSDGL